MTAQISLQPMVTTNAAGLFNVNSAGFTQGDALDDPAVKFALAGGVLSTAATTPLWGGVPIAETIPTAQTGFYSGDTQPGTDTLGGTLVQATASIAPTGISVYNQAFGGITTPQSTAPLFSPGMSVNFYRFGSGARIPLPCDASVVALAGSSIVETVYWDVVNFRLTTTATSNFAVPCKILRISTSGNKIVSYSSGTGNANWSNTIVGGSASAPVAVVQI
jgi:hypothetical protein